MKKILFISIITLFAVTTAAAQFLYSHLPAKPSESAKYKTAGIKWCKRYQVDSVYKDSVLKEIIICNTKGQIEMEYYMVTNDKADPDTSYTYTAWAIHFAHWYMIKNKVRLYHCTYNTAVKIIKKGMATIDPLTYTYIYDATKKIKEAKNPENALHGKGCQLHWKILRFIFL